MLEGEGGCWAKTTTLDSCKGDAVGHAFSPHRHVSMKNASPQCHIACFQALSCKIVQLLAAEQFLQESNHELFSETAMEISAPP